MGVGQPGVEARSVGVVLRPGRWGVVHGAHGAVYAVVVLVRRLLADVVIAVLVFIVAVVASIPVWTWLLGYP